MSAHALVHECRDVDLFPSDRAGDVVATMAWNTTRHLEVRVLASRSSCSVRYDMTECGKATYGAQCWYGIMGLSAVCHTLNPRLFRKELQYIITLAGANDSAHRHTRGGVHTLNPRGQYSML